MNPIWWILGGAVVGALLGLGIWLWLVVKAMHSIG